MTLKNDMKRVDVEGRSKNLIKDNQYKPLIITKGG